MNKLFGLMLAGLGLYMLNKDDDILTVDAPAPTKKKDPPKPRPVDETPPPEPDPPLEDIFQS